MEGFKVPVVDVTEGFAVDFSIHLKDSDAPGIDATNVDKYSGPGNS